MRLMRLVVIVVCLMIAASLFAGCGQSQNSGTEKAGETQSSTSVQGTPTETQKAEPVKIVFSIPAWGDRTIDHPTFQMVREKIKEILNVDIEWVGQQNNPSDEKIKMMLAAGEQLDAFYVDDWMPYRRSDSIMPLNGLLKKYGQDILKNSIPESIKLRTTADGNIWSAPWEQYPVTYATLIRKDWLDEFNLNVPTTIEEFENVMQVFKGKKKDEGLCSAGYTLESQFAGSFIKTGDQNWLDTDGKLKPYYLNPQFKGFLAKMQEWYKKGYIHKELVTMTGQQATDIFSSGRSGIFLNYVDVGYIENNLIALIKKNDPKVDLVGIPPLKGTEPGLFTRTLNPGWGSCIPKTSSNPEAAMKFLNFAIGTDEGHLLVNYGVEGKHWVWADKDNGIIKIPDGLKDEDKYINEIVYEPGYLIAFANKYALSAKGRDFMKWLNDEKQVRSAYSVDFGVVYDNSKFKSKDMLSSLNTITSTAEWKIIMGQKPVSYWDEVIKDWTSKGGSTYIDDITEQYNAAKKK